MLIGFARCSDPDWGSANQIMTKEQIEQWMDERRLARVQQIAEDDLRARIIEVSPEIRHDVNVLTDLIRDAVELERLKFKPGGQRPTNEELTAWAHSTARLYNDPTFTEWLENYRRAKPCDGIIELSQVEKKTKNSSPDFTGTARVEGQRYEAAGWHRKAKKLKVVLKKRI